MENTKKAANKRAIAIIASLCILAASVILVVVFCVIKNAKDSSANITLLRVTADDITMNVGQTVKDYFTVSIPDATIDIETDKQGIIQISQTSITALKSGVVNVEITATLDEAVAKDTFTVTVTTPDYTFNVKNVQGGEFENGILYVSESMPASFKVDIFDRLGQLVDVNMIDYSITSGILQNQLGTFIVVPHENCTIKFAVIGTKYSFSINVKVMK